MIPISIYRECRPLRITKSEELGEVLLQGYRCRCGHEWLSRVKGERPRVCPKCKSANWDRPKRVGSGELVRNGEKS